MNKFNQNFILASGSARRITLLDQLGIAPDLILTPNIDEKINLKELPINYVKRMANEKNFVFQVNYPHSIILSADTIVTVGRRILPKAINIEIAEACLKK